MSEENVKELKEALLELATNDGTGTQQDVARFILNLINVLLEKEKN